MQRGSWQAPLACFAVLAVGVSVINFATPAHGRGGSGGAVHVRGFIRKDGTYVAPHDRSAPDGNFQNNWSTKGNINPYTGEEGTHVTPPVPGAGSGTHRAAPAVVAIPPAHTATAKPLPPPVTLPPFNSTVEPPAPPVVVPPHEPTVAPLAAPVMAPTPPEGPPVARQHRPASAIPNTSHSKVSELDRVVAAERRRNLDMCLHHGEAFCKREMLTVVEGEQFERAERRRNLDMCLHHGEAFCKREMLTPAEEERFERAERRRNLDMCLHHGEAFCERDMLLPAEQEKVRGAANGGRR